jgi:pSer/pThr/pTyr-binding forkhead associated (FHA) protein
MYKLVISDDEGKTTVVPLVREEISIGRKEGNTIRLTERNVSRKHAKLLKANGAFVVEDLNSYNGVKVNGRKIDGRVNLKAGDQLGIGDYVLALQSDVADAPTAAVPGPSAGTDAATAMISAPTEPRPPARLVMLTPPAPGAEFALSRERQRIGRAEDLPIWVNHRSISREHAEIARDGNDFRVVDLGSANGVRVNGKDIEDAPLCPGDIVELGQVRFRYVGEGESYVFDTDATVQMEAIAAPGGVSKAPILAAIGIIGVAVVVAGVLAMGTEDDDSDRPTVTQISPIDPTTQTANEDVDMNVADCRRTLSQLDPSAALAAANAALDAAPGHAAASECRAAAERMIEEAPAFERGRAAVAQGDIEGAAMEFDNLSADSPYRIHADVARANSAFARAKLRAAQAALDAGDIDQASSLAEMILNREGVEAADRAAAEEVLRQAQQATTVLAVDDSGSKWTSW